MDEFLDALDAYMEAKAERDKAKSDCDSSWGYYGHDCEEKLEKARERFEKCFRDCVRRFAPTPSYGPPQ